MTHTATTTATAKAASDTVCRWAVEMRRDGSISRPCAYYVIQPTNARGRAVGGALRNKRGQLRTFRSHDSAERVVQALYRAAAADARAASVAARLTSGQAGILALLTASPMSCCGAEHLADIIYGANQPECDTTMPRMTAENDLRRLVRFGLVKVWPTDARHNLGRQYTVVLDTALPVIEKLGA